MTQITKERAHELVDILAEGYNWETGDCYEEVLECRDQLLRYIEQLEANQRQPVSDEKLREALASLIMKHAMKCIVSWKEAVDEAEKFLIKYTSPPNISDKELRNTWEGVKSLIASFEVQAEVRKEDLHNNCPVSTYFPIIESALSELEERRAESEWRPMYEAPDNTELLIYTGECATPEIKISMAHCTKGGWAESFATHWMPLPTPPAQEVK